jgi:hypothetical protein
MTRRGTAPGIALFSLFAFAIGSSCDASYTDCAIVCAANGDCPTGLRCNNGYCSSGPVCDATDGMGGDGDSNAGGMGGDSGSARGSGTGGSTPTGGNGTNGGDGGDGTSQGGADHGGAGQGGDPGGGAGTGAVGGGGAGGWTPREIPGLALWLDAGAVVEKIAASDTSSVGMWRDQSGNGNHALQLELSMRPVFSGMAANGRPTLVFAPITFMTIDDSESLHVGTRNFTLQVVTAWLNSTRVSPTSSGHGLIFSKQLQSSPFTGVGLYANDGETLESRLWGVAEAGIQSSSAADNLNDHTLRLCGFRRVGTTGTEPGEIEVRINGASSSRQPLPTNMDLSARGAAATIGGRRAERGQALSGTIAEVVYVIGDLSELDLERLERYLIDKYRLLSP